MLTASVSKTVWLKESSNLANFFIPRKESNGESCCLLCGLQEAILSYNQRYSNKWKFTAFHYYFNKVGLPAFELLLCYCVTFYPFLHTKYKLRDALQNEGSYTVNYCPTGNFGFVFSFLNFHFTFQKIGQTNFY